MTELPQCRWRDPEIQPTGRYTCTSVKLIKPRGVSAENCTACYCRDHEPVPDVLRRGTAKPAENQPRQLCQHLGPETGEKVACPSCNRDGSDKTRVKVMVCGIYGRCTIARRVQSVEACCRDELGKSCPSYAPPEQFRLDISANGIGDHLMGLTVAQHWQEKHPGKQLTVACRHLQWVDLFEGKHVLSRDMKDGTSVYPQLKDRGRLHFSEAVSRLSDRRPLKLRPLPEASVRWAEQYRGRIVLCPFALTSSREWPLASWEQLERVLVSQHRWPVVIGGDNDASRMTGFASPKLPGRPATDVAALLLAARCVVSNESGMAHLAGSLGVPCVLITNEWGKNLHQFWPKTVAVSTKSIANITVEHVLSVVPNA